MHRGKKVFSFISFFVMCLFSFADESSPRVSVLAFNHTDNVSARDAETLTRLFESALIGTEKFVVVKQSAVEVILKAQSFSVKEFADPEYAVRVGKLISANHVFIGRISTLGKKMILDVQLIEIEGGKAVRARSTEGTTPEDLADKIPGLAAFFGNSGKEPARPEYNNKIKVYMTLGDRFYKEGQFQKAGEQYKKALEIEEFNTRVIQRYLDARLQEILLDTLYQSHAVIDGLDIALRNDYYFIKMLPDKDADDFIEQILLLKTLEPVLEQDSALLMQEVNINKITGRISKALEILSRARVSAPSNPGILAETGLLTAFQTYREKKEVTGTDLIRRAITGQPETPLFHLYLGRSLDRDPEKADPEALREYRRSAELAIAGDVKTNRIRLFALQSMQRFFYRLASFEGGILTKTLAMEPRERLAHFLYMMENGVRFYSRTDLKNPQFFLAALYYANKEYPEAEKALQELIETRKNNWMKNEQWLQLYANILEKSGLNKEKLKEIKNYLQQLKSEG